MSASSDLDKRGYHHFDWFCHVLLEWSLAAITTTLIININISSNSGHSGSQPHLFLLAQDPSLTLLILSGFFLWIITLPHWSWSWMGREHVNPPLEGDSKVIRLTHPDSNTLKVPSFVPSTSPGAPLTPVSRFLPKLDHSICPSFHPLSTSYPLCVLFFFPGGDLLCLVIKELCTPRGK